MSDDLDEEDDADIKGLEALVRIAQEINGRDYGGAFKLRSLLRSLYNGEKTDLSAVMGLSPNFRKDFAAIIIGIGQGCFSNSKIKEAFVRPGDKEAKWFLKGKL